MHYVYDWVRTIVSFYIFFTAVLHLLPKSSYQKYVRFFGGLILVILLMNPVLDLFRNREALLDKISYETFLQNQDSLQLDLGQFEDTQREVYLSQYEKSIADDIRNMIQEDSFDIDEINIVLNEDYTLREIHMRIRRRGMEYLDVEGLKRRLSEFYQIDENRISIIVL